MRNPRIKILKEKKLAGKYLKMSLVNNRTAELWRSVIPMIDQIENTINKDKIALQIYPDIYFDNYDPKLEFVKWAAVEVTDFKDIPTKLDTFVLEGGLYAIFDYKGSSADSRIFEYIYSSWLPKSDYKLDKRPHFEVLGEKYKNNDPDSQEEVWIPIQPK